MEKIMQLRDLHYTYSDGTEALKGLNMDINKGEISAILGGNGAGKSTLFHHLNGILKPASGQVLLKGEPVDYSRKGLLKLRQSVGIVFQDPDTQLFSASVYQDVSFGAVNLKLPEQEIRRRVDNALERTGIAHLKDKPTHSLSFGQKKRVSIAGILVMEPEVLILDEPTAGLDPSGVSEIMKLVKETQKELGISVVISTHDIDIVPLYCDNVFLINKGKIILQGTPKEVFAQKDIIRSVKLRLPRIAHLFEILKEKDNFNTDEIPITISEARKLFEMWRKEVTSKSQA